MKLALISDIHANPDALQAALTDLEMRGVDRIVCLGDIVGYNTKPAECIALIRRVNAVCVAGNHDLAVCGRITTKGFSKTAVRAAAWTHRCLSRADISFLAGLPLKATIEGKLVAVHGALHPQCDCATIRLDNDERRLQTFHALIADPSGARLCAFGHTHQAAIYELHRGRVTLRRDEEVRLEDDAYYLLNPGTVGQPRAADRRASYMIVDLVRHAARIHWVAYDDAATRAATRQAGLAPTLTLLRPPLRGVISGGLRAFRLDHLVRRLASYLGL